MTPTSAPVLPTKCPPSTYTVPGLRPPSCGYAPRLTGSGPHLWLRPLPRRQPGLGDGWSRWHGCHERGGTCGPRTFRYMEGKEEKDGLGCGEGGSLEGVRVWTFTGEGRDSGEDYTSVVLQVFGFDPEGWVDWHGPSTGLFPRVRDGVSPVVVWYWLSSTSHDRTSTRLHGRGGVTSVVYEGLGDEVGPVPRFRIPTSALELFG